MNTASLKQQDYKDKIHDKIGNISFIVVKNTASSEENSRRYRTNEHKRRIAKKGRGFDCIKGFPKSHSTQKRK